MVKPHLHLQPRHLDQLCAFPTSRPLSFFSFCVVSLMSVTRIGNRPCDPQRQRERGGLHQRAERSGWAAGIRLGHWRSLRALGRIAGILHRLTLRGPFSFDFSFPGQHLQSPLVNIFTPFYMELTLCVSSLYLSVLPCYIQLIFYPPGGLARMSSGFFVRPWANHTTSLNLFPYL